MYMEWVLNYTVKTTLTMIRENIQSIYYNIPQEVTVVAVSKNHPIEAIMEAYNAGIRDFGENKVQEMVLKQAQLPPDIRWHMIGHLQRNKVKYVIPFVHLIQSADSENILKEIQKEAVKNNRKVDVLLEIHIAIEEAKYGFNADEAYAFFKNEKHKNFDYLNFKGLMGMASFTENKDIIKNEFQSLHKLYEKIKNEFSFSLPCFSELSMGMSSDYILAIESGATKVRIGSSIFGERKYT